MLKTEETANPQSCWNKGRHDERMFVLLARDEAAPAAIRAWCAERVRLGKNKLGDPQIEEAMLCAALMEDERKRINYKPHGGGMAGHDEPQLAVYRYDEDFGRMGRLTGVFIANRSDVAMAMGRHAFLGEMLGKHSEIWAEITKQTVTMISEDPAIVDTIQRLNLSTGVNPIAALGEDE
jgi:hypothetical protein